MKINKSNTKTIFIGILIVGIIFLVVVIYSLTKDDEISEQEDDKIAWEVDIPEGYSVKEDGVFISEYFEIEYIEKEKKYIVRIKKGNEYELDEIKAWITGKFSQFQDLPSVNERNFYYIDARGGASEVEELEEVVHPPGI